MRRKKVGELCHVRLIDINNSRMDDGALNVRTYRYGDPFGRQRAIDELNQMKRKWQESRHYAAASLHIVED